MGRTMLLPGERVEARIRPAWRTGIPWYLASLALPVLAAALWLLLGSDAWAAGSSGPRWKAWNYLYGNDPAAYVWVLLLLLGVGGVRHWLHRESWVPFATVGACVWVLAFGLGIFTWETAEALPAAIVSLLFPAWLAIETDRGTRKVTLTNLRVIGRAGFVRHEDVRDVELRQGPIGRQLDVGTVVLLAKPEPHEEDEDGDSAPKPKGKATRAKAAHAPAVALEFPGLHPVARAKEAIEALIRDATATPYLREREGLDRRREHAIEALQRK